jgi:hypothetical protein
MSYEPFFGHEMGHIKSRHLLYHSLAETLAGGIGISASLIGPEINLISMPMRLALLAWQRESLGPVVLRTGQSDAWTFEWTLSIRNGGSESELPTGTYNVQAGVLANTSASSVEGPNYLSNTVQLTIS